MTTVKFSDHAMLKLKTLQQHGVGVDLEHAKLTVSNPDKLAPGYGGRMIAQRKLDANHVLRVVYEAQGDDLLVITLYPARRGRYEKD